MEIAKMILEGEKLFRGAFLDGFFCIQSHSSIGLLECYIGLSFFVSQNCL
jgi:hypothetical protein